jgi:hypothetical protein
LLRRSSSSPSAAQEKPRLRLRSLAKTVLAMAGSRAASRRSGSGEPSGSPRKSDSRRPGALSGKWRQATEQEVARLGQEAQDAEDSERAAAEARRHALTLLQPSPPVSACVIVGKEASICTASSPNAVTA